MNGFTGTRLRFAVDEVYGKIQPLVVDNDIEMCEEMLWRELSCCILSSQVTYELAQSVALAIEAEGVLPSTHTKWECVAHDLRSVLGGTFYVAGRRRRYRFPTSKSAQLAKTWAAINAESETLREFLIEFNDMVSLREWMVRHAPGLGPKQSSMFLRNAGLTLDLAVLDRHVLRYMEAIDLLEEGGHHTATYRDYRTTEGVLLRHADELGYRVGLLDWAIWIVMRVARSKSVPMETAA